MADCDASQCVDETIPNVPRNVGRVVKVISNSLSCTYLGPVPSSLLPGDLVSTFSDYPLPQHDSPHFGKSGRTFATAELHATLKRGPPEAVVRLRRPAGSGVDRVRDVAGW